MQAFVCDTGHSEPHVIVMLSIKLLMPGVLLLQDLLAAFNGSWQLWPLVDSDNPSVVRGTRAVLNQDISPKG